LLKQEVGHSHNNTSRGPVHLGDVIRRNLSFAKGGTGAMTAAQRSTKGCSGS